MVTLDKDPFSSTKQGADYWKISCEQQLVSKNILDCCCSDSQP